MSSRTRRRQIDYLPSCSRHHSVRLKGTTDRARGMALTFERIAVVGATGPTGRALASELVGRKHAVRVVSRRADVLQACFPGSEFEKKPGDALKAASLAA